MGEVIRTILAGATGRTGSRVAVGLRAEPGIQLVAGVSRSAAGRDLGAALGSDCWDVPVFGSVDEALRSCGARVLVDFTEPGAAGAHALRALDGGVRPVIGTTGLDERALEALSLRCQNTGLAAVAVANFSLGAHVLLRLVRTAASTYGGAAEIVEMHHEGKKDAPSGTALRLRDVAEEAGQGRVPIHSIRLPGAVANHRIIFGGAGETLTISHDTTDRGAFTPGVVMAVRRVIDLNGLVTSMEAILDH